MNVLMKRWIGIGVLAASLFLIACGSAQNDEAETVSTDTEETTETTEQVATSREDLSRVEGFPATTLEQALEERPFDYAIGSDDAIVTIIEYGDYQ